MLTLMPSIFVGLAGMVVTAIVLAADWYVWDYRYRAARQRAPELTQFPAADGKQLIHMRSASGRELVVTVAQSAKRNPLPLQRVESAWMDLCS